MKISCEQIFKEYQEAAVFKESLGKRGISEQGRINERFFNGDQWHGANCGNERPLVRHNIIKRIGEYKMSHILSNPINVVFSADGIPNTITTRENISRVRHSLASGAQLNLSEKADTDEINMVMSTLSDYQKVISERVGFERICEQALHNAYISGSAVIYTYWDSEINTGVYGGKAGDVQIKGDIGCELLDIENVFFGDAQQLELQKQPYIIIRSFVSANELLRQCAKYSTNSDIKRVLSEYKDKKIMVLTRLFKEYNHDGSYTIKCIKAIKEGIIRQEFDTMLTRYPLALFRWNSSKDTIYGGSEITYIIPNQIAINRMITANVWAMMAAGMPIMVVNGDTVCDDITNEPGQIIKVYGSNEDVAGSIKYVMPTSFNESFDKSINTLIENTLTQCGANEVALGDSRADNATALATMRNAAIMPISLIKNRFYDFVENIARIWMDFWLCYYGSRKIKIVDENGIWYMPFNASRYRNLIINAKVYAKQGSLYDEGETLSALSMLYDKEIIDKKQFIKRLPTGLIGDTDGLLAEIDYKKENTDESD